ncbi:MAG: ferritin [Elusimicrobiaceae bacterium]
MISKTMEKNFSDQIREELESSYLYYQMAAYFKAEGLDGMSQWMQAQHDEERWHAEKFFQHIATRGGYPEIQTIAVPVHKWKTPLEAFEAALEHEVHITGRINMLVKLASGEGDYAAVEFLQWFVREQVEEEEADMKVISDLKRVGNSGDGLVMLDRELGARVSITPWPLPAAAPAN